MELLRESLRIKKLRKQAEKKITQKEEILKRAEKAKGDKSQTKLKVFL